MNDGSNVDDSQDPVEAVEAIPDLRELAQETAPLLAKWGVFGSRSLSLSLPLSLSVSLSLSSSLSLSLCVSLSLSCSRCSFVLSF